MIHDSSVIRNFAVVDLLETLFELNGGRVQVVPDVAAPTGEPSEIGARLETFERIRLLARSGSPEASRALVACQNLRVFLAKIGSEVIVEQPSASAMRLARRLVDPTPQDRAEFHLRVRRLSAAEAVSLAVALEMGESFATDDKAAAGAFVTLGGKQHKWTLDLFKEAVAMKLLNEPEARRAYIRLIEVERFRGIEWD